jgi:hypothetical protein
MTTMDAKAIATDATLVFMVQSLFSHDLVCDF